MPFQSLHFFGKKKNFSFLPSVSHATNQSLAFLIFPEVFLFFRQHAGLRLSSEFHHSHEIGPFPRNGMDIQNSEKFFLVKNVVLGSCDKIFYICISYRSLFSGPSIQICAYFIFNVVDSPWHSSVSSAVADAFIEFTVTVHWGSPSTTSWQKEMSSNPKSLPEPPVFWFKMVIVAVVELPLSQSSSHTALLQ